MRLSQHFGRTLREAPAEASLLSHQLVVRAGLARQLAAGVWSYLPLGWRAIRRIEQILREEMSATGAEEMHMPVLHPAEVWEATGRWDSFGEALQRLTNRDGHAFALGPTHEEVVVALCLREIESYKDLPCTIYQIQTKVRDEPRARGGLIRLREFLMKDAYSMHVDTEDLDSFYPKMYQAYLRVFERCGLEVIPVEADTGLMGGSASHEFVLPHPDGEDCFVRCQSCGYTANAEAAVFARREALYGDPLPLEKVATPESESIAELCSFLGIEPQRTLKAVFYSLGTGGQAEETVILAMLRGDLEVSETKLMKTLGTTTLAAATEEQILATGAVAGYASPIGIEVQRGGGSEGLLVVGDESLLTMSNFVTGANEAGYHVLNANCPRDFETSRIADVAEPFDGATCARCGGSLHIERAIELGHCFKLGTRYSEAVGATYLDAAGELHPIVMGSYGIGLDRLMAAVIETHHDDLGIIWPSEVAPFAVHIISLAKDTSIAEVAETLYKDLQAAGVEVLYDDRGLSPGVMFADADLMGIPLRITVSERSLAGGGVETKWRHSDEKEIVSLETAVSWTQEMLGKMRS